MLLLLMGHILHTNLGVAKINKNSCFSSCISTGLLPEKLVLKLTLHLFVHFIAGVV